MLRDVPRRQWTTFERDGFAVSRGFITSDMARFLSDYVQLRQAGGFLNRGDDQVPRALHAYGDPCFDALLEHMRPAAEFITNIDLLPTNSYLRVYGHGDILEKHTDRPSCEISLTLNIQKTHDWPIYIGFPGEALAFELEPSDALFYRGIDLPHWRLPFQGDRMVQVFFHYVDAKGPHAHLKFDGRRSLMRMRSDKA